MTDGGRSLDDRAPDGVRSLREQAMGIAGSAGLCGDGDGGPGGLAGGAGCGDQSLAAGAVGHDSAGGVVTRPARSIQFTVPGNPVGKGRPIVGKSFGGHTTLRTPAKTVSYENLVGWTAAQAMAGRALMDGPLKCSLNLECAIPESWSDKRKIAAAVREIRPTTKPDIDNVVKAIFDAMNGVVWKDDVQVVLLEVSKFYGPFPGVRVYVDRLDAKASHG